MSNNTISVRTTDATVKRGGSPKELRVEVLAENVNLFLTQIEGILEKAPDEVGKFQFTEFSVSAEVSANGKLVMLGSGVETGIQGSLTFKFSRKV
ncbi:MAG: hypothetical protein AAGE84_06960 [Cyanobacteria bacterium P01_G01_bin.39]